MIEDSGLLRYDVVSVYNVAEELSLSSGSEQSTSASYPRMLDFIRTALKVSNLAVETSYCDLQALSVQYAEKSTLRQILKKVTVISWNVGFEK
jgi:hypothetical protein